MKLHNVIKKRLAKNTSTFEDRDWESAKMIYNYVNNLKVNDEYTTLSNIAGKLGITSRELRIYLSWAKVGEVLGERIDKSKADVLNTFITGGELEELRNFWRVNKKLSTRSLKEAKKIYTDNVEIGNYQEVMKGDN